MQHATDCCLDATRAMVYTSDNSNIGSFACAYLEIGFRRSLAQVQLLLAHFHSFKSAFETKAKATFRAVRDLRRKSVEQFSVTPPPVSVPPNLCHAQRLPRLHRPSQPIPSHHPIRRSAAYHIARVERRTRWGLEPPPAAVCRTTSATTS